MLRDYSKVNATEAAPKIVSCWSFLVYQYFVQYETPATSNFLASHGHCPASGDIREIIINISISSISISIDSNSSHNNYFCLLCIQFDPQVALRFFHSQRQYSPIKKRKLGLFSSIQSDLIHHVNPPYRVFRLNFE